jgi:tetratricopeptide (TPR) repeat protein
MGRYKDALDSFYNLISDYPMSQKLAASTLKIGQIYTKQGDRDKAQMMFERVTASIPIARKPRWLARPWRPLPQRVNRSLPSQADPDCAPFRHRPVDSRTGVSPDRQDPTR